MSPPIVYEGYSFDTAMLVELCCLFLPLTGPVRSGMCAALHLVRVDVRLPQFQVGWKTSPVLAAAFTRHTHSKPKST